jgi:Tol biopolymer transport system component
MRDSGAVRKTDHRSTPTVLRVVCFGACCAFLWLGARRAEAAVCLDPVVCQYSRHLYPSWTPDGTRIVFSSYRVYATAISIANADGTGSVEVIGPIGEAEGSNTGYLDRTYPSFSPDGARIAYSTSGTVAVTNDVGPDDIFIGPANRTETGVVNLTNHPAQDFHPRWSPDGTRIAFASDRDGDFEIYTVRVDGTDLRQLTHNTASDSHPGSWSADSQRIAFVSDRDGNPEIYVVNADGTGETRLTNDPAADSHPAFSPDGGHIAFHSDRDGDREIYVMAADGSNPTRLTNRPADDHDPSWSPDGSRIAFATNVNFPDIDGFYDIHTIHPDGSGETRVTFANEVSLGGKSLTLKAPSDGSIKQT